MKLIIQAGYTTVSWRKELRNDVTEKTVNILHQYDSLDPLSVLTETFFIYYTHFLLWRWPGRYRPALILSLFVHFWPAIFHTKQCCHWHTLQEFQKMSVRQRKDLCHILVYLPAEENTRVGGITVIHYWFVFFPSADKNEATASLRFEKTEFLSSKIIDIIFTDIFRTEVKPSVLGHRNCNWILDCFLLTNWWIDFLLHRLLTREKSGRNGSLFGGVVSASQSETLTEVSV